METMEKLHNVVVRTIRDHTVRHTIPGYGARLGIKAGSGARTVMEALLGMGVRE
jgi:hypothetical protein